MDKTPPGVCNWDGIVMVGFNAFKASSKIYGPLFLLSAVLSKKIFSPSFVITKLIPSIVRSSLFVAVIGAIWVRLCCLFSYWSGGHYRWVYFWSPVIASSIGLLVEKKDRRNELTVFICQQAAEALFRMGASRNYWSPVKNGMTYLFASAMALLVYFQNYHENVLGQSTHGLLKLCLGQETRPDFIEVKMSKIYSNLKKKMFGPISEPPKHQLCKHQWSCRAYALVGFMKSFSLGFLIRLALKLAPLFLNPKKLIKKPSILLDANILRLGLFLGLMNGISRSSICILRALRGKDDGLNALFSGYLAGFSFLLNGSTEVAMYVASKAAESLYYHLVNLGYLFKLPYGEVLAFAASCGVMFVASVFEPHNIRPSYIKFLTRASGGRYGWIVKAFAPVREEYGVPNPEAYFKWKKGIQKFLDKY
eukprot:TRINITY_DN5292_c0_g1_i1.p1 TRINITY_DN5292_c0_g1~~TRINITY_DN5292_c0_g1_i1.p1  ORF type:complete len:476 (+),score=76.03 TRINITY_DN5292_c0_g1_i1:168-1430(+)